MDEEMMGKEAGSETQKETDGVNATAIPDKETKGTEETGQEKTTSVGEYKEANMKYLKGMNPDAEINDDNYGTMLEKSFSEMAPKMERFNKANDKFKQMMNAEPVMAKVMADVSQGSKFVPALARYVDFSSMTPVEGDPDYTEWEANNAKRMEEWTASQERNKSIEENVAKSEATVSSWMEKKQLKDEEAKSFASFVTELFDKAYSGEVTENFLNRMFQAWKYEDDVKTAEEVGITKGKNAKIMEEKFDEEKAKTGDGMPFVDGGKAKEEETKKESPIMSGLRSAVNKKSILSGN